MYTIDTAKFNQTVQRLVGYIIGEQEKGTYDNPTRVDFDSGWLYKEEGCVFFFSLDKKRNA